MISGCFPLVLSSSANARSCMSVSERRCASPNLFADILILFVYSSWGVLIFTLPFSIAALKRIHPIDVVFISSCTFGTVTCSLSSAKGSYPARNADVSKMAIFFCVLLFVCMFCHLEPWYSSLQLRRS